MVMNYGHLVIVIVSTWQVTGEQSLHKDAKTIAPTDNEVAGERFGSAECRSGLAGL